MASTISAGTTSGTAIAIAGDTSGQLQLQTNGTTTALTINTAQGVQALNCIGVGNATPSTSGAGITFPATQSASTDANTLEDYEEGTWTPAIAGSATAGTTSYTTQTGWYTKIGNLVTVGLYVNFSSATGTGVMNITGLPFASANTYLTTGSIMTQNIDWPNGYTMATLFKPQSNSVFEIYCSADNVNWAQVQMEPAGEIIGGCTYRI
jgi:hypothetical protein